MTRKTVKKDTEKATDANSDEKALYEDGLFEYLEKKYSITREQILKLSKEQEAAGNEKETISTPQKPEAQAIAKQEISDQDISKGFPIIILKSNLSSLEAIVKYLREEKRLSYIRIGMLLKRNPKTLAVTYNIARKKSPERLILDADSDSAREIVGFEAFDSGLSILESICVHLKARGMKYSQIAQMIGKDQRTVWTAFNRAQKKLGISRQKARESEHE